MFTGLAAYLVYEYAPTARGSGIPEAGMMGMGELDMHFNPLKLKEQSSNIPRTI